MPDSVSLKEHLEALGKAEQRAVDLVREWVKERLETHNGILNEWRMSSDRDRATFARKDALEALQKEFGVYKEITAKALTLAEGKSSGVGMTLGTIVSIITSGAALIGVAVLLLRP